MGRISLTPKRILWLRFAQLSESSLTDVQEENFRRSLREILEENPVSPSLFHRILKKDRGFFSFDSSSRALEVLKKIAEEGDELVSVNLDNAYVFFVGIGFSSRLNHGDYLYMDD